MPTKYRRWYDWLIDRARDRQLDGYKEQHHVVPRSLIKAFGLKRAAAMVFQRIPSSIHAPENLVKLTVREHFLAHWLLTKITKGVARRKMLNALSSFMCKNGEQAISGRQCEIARCADRDARIGPVVKNHSPASRAKIGAASRNRSKGETELARYYDASDNLLYIGIAKNIERRNQIKLCHAPWLPLLIRFTIEKIPTRSEAWIARTLAIKKEKPEYNKMCSEEHSARMMGNKHSKGCKRPDVGARNKARKGYKPTPEQRAARSARMTGVKRPDISARQTGRKRGSYFRHRQIEGIELR